MQIPFPLLLFVQNKNKVSLASVFGNSCGLTSTLLYCTRLYCTGGPCTWGLGLRESVAAVTHLGTEASLSRNLKGGRAGSRWGERKTCLLDSPVKHQRLLGPLGIEEALCLPPATEKKRREFCPSWGLSIKDGAVPLKGSVEQ